MKKRELIKLLEEKVKITLDEIITDKLEFDYDKYNKIGIRVIMAQGFLDFIKKEKAFNLKISLSDFDKAYEDTISEISNNFTKDLKDLVYAERSIGINILKEEIDKSRK